MKKVFAILLLLCCVSFCRAQKLVVNGSVAAGGVVQDGVLIDVYENSAPIQTLHTDRRGLYTFRLDKGKEYLIVFYKSGYVLQSVSMADSRENPISNYFLPINMEKDEHSPEGLYFKTPVRRIVPESTMSYFTDSKFAIERIKPPKRADSVRVLLNRAEANQYILVGNMKLATSPVDTKYSRQIEKDIAKEVATYSDKLRQNSKQYDSINAEEDRHQKITMTTTGDKQLDEITETQRLLAQRLGMVTDHYLLEQQQMLARARMDEMDALRFEHEPDPVSDTINIYVGDRGKKSRSRAVNDRYRAMDANRKFQLYNKYQTLNYQEYIELLRYKQNKEDTAKRVAAKPAPAPAKPLATITPADTSDNLSKLNDEQRTKLIREALDEEERFKNYKAETAEKTINGVDLTVTDITIADDHYEMQVDKKKNARYFKNNKPVTRLTFEFETTRRMVDVLSTIRQVEKFGK